MTDVYEQLNRIEERLERIEDLLLENTQEDNNRLDIKETKELMQDICKFYIEHTPIINIVERTRLHLFRFRESICSIKNIDNNKWQRRKIMKYINKLEQYQFITKVSSDTYQVLSTGASWWDMEEPISK